MAKQLTTRHNLRVILVWAGSSNRGFSNTINTNRKLLGESVLNKYGFPVNLDFKESNMRWVALDKELALPLFDNSMVYTWRNSSKCTPASCGVAMSVDLDKSTVNVLTNELFNFNTSAK